MVSSDASAGLSESPESARVRLVITVLTGVVFLGVVGVIYLLPTQAEHGGGPSVLASLNAFLNSCATVCLLLGYVFIRKRNIVWHRRMMLAAFGISSTFLITYLLHHARVGSVPFRGTGLLRVVYFALLFPHILLAMIVVPLALFTIYRGWTTKLEAHRRIARITLPIWLYVSVSGVLVYFLLYHVAV